MVAQFFNVQSSKNETKNEDITINNISSECSAGTQTQTVSGNTINLNQPDHCELDSLNIGNQMSVDFNCVMDTYIDKVAELMAQSATKQSNQGVGVVGVGNISISENKSENKTEIRNEIANNCSGGLQEQEIVDNLMDVNSCIKGDINIINQMDAKTMCEIGIVEKMKTELTAVATSEQTMDMNVAGAALCFLCCCCLLAICIGGLYAMTDEDRMKSYGQLAQQANKG